MSSRLLLLVLLLVEWRCSGRVDVCFYYFLACCFLFCLTTHFWWENPTQADTHTHIRIFNYFFVFSVSGHCLYWNSLILFSIVYTWNNRDFRMRIGNRMIRIENMHVNFYRQWSCYYMVYVIVIDSIVYCWMKHYHNDKWMKVEFNAKLRFFPRIFVLVAGRALIF